jgi:hypothetical protein
LLSSFVVAAPIWIRGCGISAIGFVLVLYSVLDLLHETSCGAGKTDDVGSDLVRRDEYLAMLSVYMTGVRWQGPARVG